MGGLRMERVTGGCVTKVSSIAATFTFLAVCKTSPDLVWQPLGGLQDGVNYCHLIVVLFARSIYYLKRPSCSKVNEAGLINSRAGSSWCGPTSSNLPVTAVPDQGGGLRPGIPGPSRLCATCYVTPSM